MNKYQRVMEHVKVDDEMKKRILQNVEKELESGAEKAHAQGVETSKVVPFRQRLGEGIKKYGTMVAMVAILLVGTAAVIRITGGVSNTSAPSMSDSAMEAPAAAPAEEAPVEEAEPVKPVQPVGSAKTEGAEQEIIVSTQPSAVHYVGPVVLLIIVLAVIALIIWLIIYLIRKFRSKK